MGKRDTAKLKNSPRTWWISKKWIQGRVTDPRRATIDIEAGRNHWAAGQGTSEGEKH